MSRIAIAGAGLSGAVIGRELAQKGFEVHIFEEKKVTGGHCRTDRDPETGVMVHTYGPHIFHTDMEWVWEYVNRFATFKPYVNRVKAHTDRGTFSLPVNLLTLSQFFGKPFTPREAKDFIAAKADRSIKEPANFEEQGMSLMGRELYETFFRGYTLKQWGRDPKELPASVLKRLPFRFNYEDNYFNHPFQGMPEDGYSVLIDNILACEGIHLHLGETFDASQAGKWDHVFWSGGLDRYFDYAFGRLEYRTLDFETFRPGPEQTMDGDYQGTAVVNYCSPSVPWTRITEHKHFAPWEKHQGTICYKEFSRSCGPDDTPYYPVLLSGANTLLDTYKSEAGKLEGVTFIGRLGLYQYFDMDKTIAAAMATVREFLERFRQGGRLSMAFPKELV